MHIFNTYFYPDKNKADVLQFFFKFISVSVIPHKEFRLQFQNSETVQIYGFIEHAFEGNSGFIAMLLREPYVLLGYATTSV